MALALAMASSRDAREALPVDEEVGLLQWMTFCDEFCITKINFQNVKCQKLLPATFRPPTCSTTPHHTITTPHHRTTTRLNHKE